MLVSAVQQHESVIIMYTYFLLLEPPPPPPGHHRAPGGASRATQQLPIYLHEVVYVCRCYLLNLPHLRHPPLCPQVCALCLCLHSFPAHRFIITIVESIYMRSYRIFIFLFLTYFTVYNTEPVFKVNIHQHAVAEGPFCFLKNF